MAGGLYLGNQGTISDFPSHAAHQPMNYSEAINSFVKYFMAAAIEQLPVHNYKSLEGALNLSRYGERLVEKHGLTPFMQHYYTEQSGQRRLSDTKLAKYTPWKQSIDAWVSTPHDIARPNLDPRIKISYLAAKIIEEAQASGDFDLKRATKKFSALYVASVVNREYNALKHAGKRDYAQARFEEEKPKTVLSLAKENAARYLDVSERTIERRLKDAQALGYARIARIRDPGSDYIYELMVLEQQKNSSGIEDRVAPNNS